MFKHPFPRQKSKLNKINKIILISSGKGGVGKSTIASNIAICLEKSGYKIGLLDSDVYGPSIPRIFNINQKPEIKEGLIQPHEEQNIKLMSMGFLVPESSALVWRGPMLTKAIHQLFKLTNWGNLDYLIVDTPPGTGDIHLSIAENYAIDGAVIVTTPQKLALIDAFKAVDMYNKLKIKIMGIIENMSYLSNPINQNKEYIFGKSNLQDYCNDKNIDFLGTIPMLQKLASKMLLTTNDDKELEKTFKSITQKL
ncbi:Mrp/NBP35 family ATP-binding protein [Rickettsiales endosymbiont of Trichoplax sp. H2]|uniref:Mrp/NBP35 family ATP-binding protein n=1 Tax=Rickettsiales endosymbiont of Trichoplax sp. H2 TaxID=2021221 RepID=UPI0012B39A85|nr:Mrp/NBP35 family ATP-binding protein [Rickettsiales endosymbiont of Trichoplax sp. H2]MSO14212.1 Iron-sulfur cluster carrier protein [Rickettsiales endosymbiont of Trichoplax sp. H2]